MTSLIMRCAIVCVLFCGCENPFRSRGTSPLLGVWQAQNPTLEIETIAFLSKGRYWENNVQVGTYTVLSSQGGASGAENIVYVLHSVRIDYLSGEQYVMEVRTLSHTRTEIEIAGKAGRGGPPSGDYYKLHTGDGL